MLCSLDKRILNGVIPCGVQLAGASKRVRMDGPDVSWLHDMRVGDDQGDSSACVIFALANWLEAMENVFLSDNLCRDIWRATLRHYGRSDGGLTIPEGFAGMQRAGYLHHTRGIAQVYDYDRMGEQPLVACYKVVPAWNNMSFEGCFDHSPEARKGSYGNHAVLLSARGRVTKSKNLEDLGMIFTIINSWSLEWGKNGMGQGTQDFHDQTCFEMWAVRL